MGSRAESGAGAVTMAKPRTPLNQLTATIGGVAWQITFTPTWHTVSNDPGDSERHDGITEFHECEIRVAGDLAAARQRRTLMHELVHAVAESYKIRELFDETGGGHKEHAVDQLATGLCEALESLGIFLPTTKRES